MKIRNMTRMPPTEKQVEYAEYLAKRVGVNTPKEYTREAYSEFISEMKSIVQEEDDGMNEPDKWQLSYM